MIRIDKQENLPEVPDVTIWGDDQSEHIFYVLPSTPRFRLQDGKPVFKSIKYRNPIDRPDGKKGGGYVIFDTEIAVSDAQMAKLTEVLQDRITKRHAALKRPGQPPKVQFGTITYTRGTVRLLMEEDGNLIEKVRGAGKPSLYGRNVACFALELSEKGIQVFEAAMQGQGASMVSVIYDLNFWVKLPPLKAVVHFDSHRFYEYAKEVDLEVSWWSEDHYREDFRQVLEESKSAYARVEANFVLPDPEQDRKLKDRLRDWANRTLEDELTRQVQQATAEADPNKIDSNKIFEKTLEDLGGDDLDNFKQVIREEKWVNIDYSYTENSAAEWNLAPQGNLPTITSLKDNKGQPLKWEDYSLLIDETDPFFKQLNVNMQVNAEFETLPLHSVEVHVEYDKAGGKKEIGEYRFVNTNDVNRFSTYIDNDNQDYTYWYEVNFKGQARTFKSKPIKTNEKLLTINLDDTGIFNMDILTGDIDFDQVRVAQVDVRYPAGANVPQVQQKFTIDQNHQNHRLQKVLFTPVDQKYQYQVKYVMNDGKEIVTGPFNDDSKPMIVDDPFSEIRRVIIRASGNLNEKVQTIFLDLSYLDVKNSYSLSKSIALDVNMSADEWAIPIIMGSQGVVKYSGLIRYYDGTEEPVEETVAERNSIIVGPSVREVLEITVLPDLMFDNPEVRLVRVSLNYNDSAHSVLERKDFSFRPGDIDPQIWTVELKDKSKVDYHWLASFYLNGGAPKKVEETTTELTIVPQLPEV